jgi:hypothetical protein
MVDFLRPEARATLWRWREVLCAAVVLILGLWWGLTTFGFGRLMGGVVALLGLAMGVVALQRLRFGMGSGGAGLVEVDERRLAYFGPLSGGVIDLGDLVRVDLDPTGKPAHWVLTDLAGQMVHIPVDAAGAEALFDVFAALPGIRTERMLELLRGNPGERVLIWQTAARARLH